MTAERAVNAVTAALALAIVVSLGQRYQGGEAGRAEAPTTLLTESSGIDFARAKRTLIIVVQQGCTFCEDSMPFYRRLVETRNQRNPALQIVVAAPRRDTDIGGYLASHGVTADTIVHPAPGVLPVRFTPTLLLAEPNGTLASIWQGGLSAPQERDVFDTLFPTP
jgi:hypothetical protein